MRKMQSKLGTINVVEHVITKNFWEYYITDDKHDDDIVKALVMGFETEMGDISLSEIKPYVISRTKKLNEVMAAEGWRWEE